MKKDKRSKNCRPEFAPRHSVGAALLSAAMSLPLAGTVHADSAPERGLISVKHLNYQDSQGAFNDQPAYSRIHVDADQVLIMAPITGAWSLSGTYTADVISGASPARYTLPPVTMHDKRHSLAADVTRYFPNGTVTVGANISGESDYLSRGVSVSATHSNENKNTTWNAGIGVNNDIVHSNIDHTLIGTKYVNDFLVGVTQVLTINDIVQLSLGLSEGRGYFNNGNGIFSDPYKTYDFRPGTHNKNTVMTRWNHYFESTEGTGRFSYRYYTDSWSIKAHTLDAEYVQPLSRGWTVTPLVRIYTQSAASFYADAPQVVSPFAPAITTTYYSEDQRVSAFGAHTLGLKIAKQIDADWLADIKYESYAQRASWRFFGAGSPNLAPFDARSLQLGLSRQF